MTHVKIYEVFYLHYKEGPADSLGGSFLLYALLIFSLGF